LSPLLSFSLSTAPSPSDIFVFSSSLIEFFDFSSFVIILSEEFFCLTFLHLVIDFSTLFFLSSSEDDRLFSFSILLFLILLSEDRLSSSFFSFGFFFFLALLSDD